MDQVTRQDLADLDRAVSAGWQLPPDLKASLPARLAALAEQATDLRIAVRASEVLRKMNADNVAQGSPNQHQEPVIVFLPLNGRESPQ
jgi:hypothetical protein